MLKPKVLSLALLAFLLAVIVPAAGSQDAVVWPTGGWPTSTPEAQGLSSAELAGYVSTWLQPQFNMDSLLVIRNGYLVAEAYTPLNGPENRHRLYSASKTITSALIGVLLQEGLLKSLDTPVLELFPDREVANVDARKQAMTVRDLLMMAGGLDINDMQAGQLEVPATSSLMEQSEDWVQFALDLPMAAEPGAQWYYSNPGVHILSGIISELTGKSALDYAAEKLFGPLGITDYYWPSSPTGVSIGYAELELTPRDMAKIGYLYLNDGQWDDQQIIPADYARASLGRQINTPFEPNTVYGYLWWRLNRENFSFALGHGGQVIMVLPDKDLVVVTTGGMTEDVRVPLNGYGMFFNTVALAAADEALPANPEAVAQLEAVIAGIQQPEAAAVPPLPALAARISGRPFYLFNPRLFVPGNFHSRFFDYEGLTHSLYTQTLALKFDSSAEALMTVGFTDNTTWAIPVGLDGVYRPSEGRLGKVGAKGEWVTDDLFRIYMKEVGKGWLHIFDINFVPGATPQAQGAFHLISFEYQSGEARGITGFMMPSQ